MGSTLQVLQPVEWLNHS